MAWWSGLGRRNGAGGLLAGVLMVMAAMHSLGAEPRRRGGAAAELVIVNRTPVAMNELYVSPSASEDWGPDRLGDGVLAPGRSLRLRVAGLADCLVDVQALYEDGSREERRRVDSCHDKQLTLDGSGTGNAAAATHPVEIVNEAARPIQQLFISPAAAGDWGEDLLARTSVSVGERARVVYRGGCLADMRVVFDNRGAEERRDLDICALAGVRIRPGWTTADTLAPVAPLEPLEVTVVNHAGHTARAVRMAPSGDAGRTVNILGQVVADGATATVRLIHPRDACRYDAHIEFDDHAPPQDLRGVDLCRDPTLTLLPAA